MAGILTVQQKVLICICNVWGPAFGDLKSWGLSCDNRLTEHQSFYTGSSHLAPISLLPAWWSQGISELQEQTLLSRDKKWKLPNSSGLDPNIGKASLLAYSISQGTQVHLGGDCSQWESVQESVDIFTLPECPWAGSPWFLHIAPFLNC